MSIVSGSGGFHSMQKLPLLAMLAVGLAGCAAIPSLGSRGASAPSPEYRVGDRWVYEAEDGFRVKDHWIETHEVTSASPAGIALRITRTPSGLAGVRIETLPAPGQVNAGALCGSDTRYFEAPLHRFNFPLSPGQTWNQWVANAKTIGNTAARGDINHYVRVLDWARVTTPAGSFDAIRLQVITYLDDAEFWHGRTRCDATIWYAPAVRNVVREERDAGYLLSGDSDRVPTLHEVLQLTGFTAGIGGSERVELGTHRAESDSTRRE
jgi:hypothetical protein